jgi:hypothetical protein
VRDFARIPEASKPDKSSSLLLRFPFGGDRAQHAEFQPRPAVLALASRNPESELLEDRLLDDIYLSEESGLGVRAPRSEIPAGVAG